MPDTKRDFYNVCPHCWSVRVKLRIFKIPRFKCEVCEREFPNKKRLSHEDRKLFNDAMKLTRMKTNQVEGLVNEGVLRTVTVRAVKVVNQCLK